MMRPLLYVLALGVVAIVAVWAYRVNYDTLAVLDRVERLQREIAAEREAIAVLRAEWAWLNRPERLARLAARHADALGLVPMTPSAFGEAQMVAFQPPPPQPPGPAPAPLLALASGDVVPTAMAPDAPAVPAAPRPPLTPPAPPAPAAAEPEPQVRLASLAGTDYISLGIPLPPPRPTAP